MTRRADGEGTRGRRADGRYYVAVMYLRKRKFFYGKTQKEANERFKEFQRQVERGADLSNRDLTIEVFLLQYYNDVAVPTLAPKTAHRYKEIIDLYLVPQLGRHKLRELNPRHVQAFLNGLPKTLAGNTIRNIRALLRKALNVALGWHLVEYNAAQPVALPKKGVKKKVNALEPSQVTKFFAAIKDHPREVLYRVATIIGLREGEILALLKADVNLEKRELHITKQVQIIDGVVTVRATKTEASSRWVVIPDILVPYFERQLLEQPECSLLFPSSTGTYIMPRNLVRQFKGLLTVAGLPGTIRFHDLRHTAGSWALANGMDVKTAQEMLGHTQASTTLNIYGHSLTERRSTVVNDAVNKGFGVDSSEDGTQQ